MNGCTRVCPCVRVHPVSRADNLVGGPGTGAEVELLDGETFLIKTNAVRPAGGPVLDVSQVRVSIDQHVSSAAQRNTNPVTHTWTLGRL